MLCLKKSVFGGLGGEPSDGKRGSVLSGGEENVTAEVDLEEWKKKKAMR